MPDRLAPNCANIADRALVHASQLHQTCIGTQHVLLALLEDPTTAAARALAALGVTAENIKQRVGGTGTTPPEPTPAYRDLFPLALFQAVSLGYSWIHPEHFLLAMASGDHGMASVILHELLPDGDLRLVRTAVMVELGYIPQESVPEQELVAA